MKNPNQIPQVDHSPEDQPQGENEQLETAPTQEVGELTDGFNGRILYASHTEHDLARLKIRKEITEDAVDNTRFDDFYKAGIGTVEMADGRSVNIIDVSPEDYSKNLGHSPEKIATYAQKGTIFFSPGWLDTLESNKYFIRSLLEKGYRVVSLEYPRKQTKGKSLEQERLEYMRAAVDSVNFDKNSAFGLGFSLGAIDLAQFLDPKSGDMHTLFKDLVLINPAGLNKKKEGFIHLIKNYLKHGKQKKTGDSDHRHLESSFSPPEEYSKEGVPVTHTSVEIRKRVTQEGKENFGKSLTFAGREALRVGKTKIQDPLTRLKQAGHSVTILSSENDSLLPSEELDIDDTGITTLPLTLAGYHNTPREISKWDPDSEQWQAWFGALDAAFMHRSQKEANQRTEL
ncbi:hypothetical protein CVV38_02455 [Candidatus Peregrinibacteria bacterium HGW-Peregrinibacteria-1]|jgi:hypothetical protein|nr:MAG: hypothetical protein CVV38_02455 [Candidatus Peregrinibacteria bacterium HGW-Peregrinibacteria-1]